jgi:hypothetical protein
MSGPVAHGDEQRQQRLKRPLFSQPTCYSKRPCPAFPELSFKVAAISKLSIDLHLQNCRALSHFHQTQLRKLIAIVGELSSSLRPYPPQPPFEDVTTRRAYANSNALSANGQLQQTAKSVQQQSGVPGAISCLTLR